MDAWQLERISCTDSCELKSTLIPFSKVQALLWIVSRPVAKAQTWHLVAHFLETTRRQTWFPLFRRTPKTKLNGNPQPDPGTKLCPNNNRKNWSSQSRQGVAAEEDYVEETSYLSEFLQKHHIWLINEHAWTGTWRIELRHWESQLSFWLPHKEQLLPIRAERDETKLIWNHAQELPGPSQTTSNQTKPNKEATIAFSNNLTFWNTLGCDQASWSNWTDGRQELSKWVQRYV